MTWVIYGLEGRFEQAPQRVAFCLWGMSLGETAAKVINKDWLTESLPEFFAKIMRSPCVLIMFIATASCIELTKLET
ncbi:hypothetical protein MJO28_008372 [Puccinia striiformis f. sp. tritici]|uniref:Uncharacterized protein n=1 Tax=Puccinia striiformis f. sp. tritici TaxID=168172 RepID=A0ACC0ECH4_9BASI|nr:hypothetical protein MJO28_008372 [Puccinia striiformis f. sp. tritici]